MKIIFLGTNGWYDTETGNTLSILVETKNEYIILDAGGGFHKIGRYIKGSKPIYLFLSHLHLDHIIGLHTFIKFIFPQGVDLYCPARTKKFLTRIINRPYTVPFGRLKTKVRLHELRAAKLPFILEDIERLKHPVICLGFRFMLENKIISYCPDTGLCRNLSKLAKGADILITECSAKPGKKDKKWPHLDAEEAAKVAKQAGAKKLILIHFNPHLYPSFEERKKVLKAAKKIFKNTLIAYDNQTVNL